MRSPTKAHSSSSTRSSSKPNVGGPQNHVVLDMIKQAEVDLAHSRDDFGTNRKRGWFVHNPDSYYPSYVWHNAFLYFAGYCSAFVGTWGARTARARVLRMYVH